MRSGGGGRRMQHDGPDIDRDLDALLESHLRDAPERAPDHLLAATTVRVHRTPQRRRNWSLGRWMTGWAVMAAVIALAVIGPLLRGEDSDQGVRPSDRPSVSTLVLGPAREPVILRRTATSTTVRRVLTVGDDVWAVLVDGLVHRIDPTTGEVLADFDARLDDPTGVAAGAGAIWIGSNDGSLVKVDVATDRVDTVVPVGIAHHAVVANDAAVWVAGSSEARRIDAGTLEITPFDIPAGVLELAVVGDDVWATYPSGSIVVANGRTGTIKATIGGVSGEGRTQGGILAPGPTDVWLTDPREGATLHRVDPLGPGIVASVRVSPPARPSSLAPDAAGVWVLLGDDGLLFRLERETLEVSDVIEVGAGGRGIGFVPGGLALWGGAGVRVLEVEGGG